MTAMWCHSDSGGGYSVTTNPRAEPGVLVHAAVFYRSKQDYLTEVVPFVVNGLALGQAMMVALPSDKLTVVSDALADAASEVTLADLTEVARNPGRMLAMMGIFAEKNSHRRVGVVGELIWPGRTAEEYPACVQCEALCNVAFEGRAVTGLCLYNAARLDESVLADARTTHPLLWNGGSMERNADYGPAGALVRYNQPLPGDSMAVTYTVRELADLSPARSFAARYARWLGLSVGGIEDLQLIATELATNSLQHAGGACRLAFWQHNRHIVCRASDSGRLGDPLAGHRPPATGTAEGRGLFLVNAVADLVRTHATAAGTTIQAYLRLDSQGGR